MKDLEKSEKYTTRVVAFLDNDVKLDLMAFAVLRNMHGFPNGRIISNAIRQGFMSIRGQLDEIIKASEASGFQRLGRGL